jgi:nicotinate-nucleotide--dimethylbenzimidazole phosphoribosyltransferase
MTESTEHIAAAMPPPSPADEALVPSVDVLADVAAAMEWPDHEAEAAARSYRRASPGSDGQLGDVVEWLAGIQACFPPRDVQRARLIVFAADHGVAVAGVSAAPAGSSAARAADIAAGADPFGALAEFAGAGLRVVDVGLDQPASGVPTLVTRRGSGRIDREDALTATEVAAAVRAGVAVADEEIDSGTDLLLTAGLGVGGSTPAATLISVITGIEPVKVVGRGSGIDDQAWMRKATVVRDARRRGLPYRQDQVQLLAVSGGADLAALAGFMLRAAARRTPLVLDGVLAAAASLVAHEVSPRAMRWWTVAHAVPDRGFAAALPRLGLRPLVDLQLSRGDGIGALIAVPLLRSAVRLTTAASVPS